MMLFSPVDKTISSVHSNKLVKYEHYFISIYYYCALTNF